MLVENVPQVLRQFLLRITGLNFSNPDAPPQFGSENCGHFGNFPLERTGINEMVVGVSVSCAVMGRRPLERKLFGWERRVFRVMSVLMELR